jgi:hypothetical protein
MLTVLNSDSWDPIELMDIRLVGQDSSAGFHFTGAGEPITFNGNTYIPINMTRGQVEERLASSSGELPGLTLTITNVDAQMARLLATADLEGSEVTLWLHDRQLAKSGRTRDAIQVVIGEARDAVLADEVLTFTVTNILGQMERLTIPRRVYQANCNYVFGEAACGAFINTEPVRIVSTAQAGSTVKYFVVDPAVLVTAGSPADPTDFWANGYIGATDGPAGLQMRQIQRVETFGGATRFYLRGPLYVPPNAGDPITIRQMCRKIKSDCVAFQGNALQFGGFEEVPPVRFKPQVFDLTGI